jgi:membrane-associated phospholipid phosphatase
MMIRRQIAILGAALLFGVSTTRVSSAQEQGTGPSISETEPAKHNASSRTDAPPDVNAIAKTSERTRMGLVGRFLDDQRTIWTSPARLRFSDTEWLVPLGGITAGLLAMDHDFSKHLSQNPTTISHYKTLSNGGVAALIGGAGGMWLLGHAKHNEHWGETGFLAGEAALNSLVAVEGMKYSLRRERPFQGDGSGSFFQRGGTSLPSEHAAAAWSVAGVIAHEYPGPLTKIMAYGLASLVSVSRVKAHQHFPSDVLVGSVMGNLIAQNIYSRHHDLDLGGGEWRSISQLFRGDGTYSPGNQGSPYVPLDSWIYPALDRLAGLGLIDSGFTGLRPWTRRECMRQLSDADEKLVDRGEENSEARKLVDALQREFRSETEVPDGEGSGAFRLESLYSRTEHISGAPINNGYYFAQTQINDFGRPFGEGWSTVNGFSAYATWGRWVTSARGEWQTAPGAPALPLAARETIARVDQLPSSMLPPATSQASVRQFSLLDAYAGLTLSNWQVTFGKQSFWWGPGNGGPMTFSENAEPVNMFRINRVSPLKLPSLLGWLGPIRTEFFLGQLAGHELLLSPLGLVGQFGQSYSPQPFIHGQKLSFKPSRNFEFGFFRTTIYGGPGYPFTWHTFLRSLLSTANKGTFGTARKPGKRTSGLDFSYRLPGLRNWLTFYADGLAYDEFSPIAYADRSVWRAGLYFSQIPKVHKLDLRVEGVYTDNPLGGNIGHGFYYYNSTWLSGYTNKGNLLGSWVGREGQGAQAWSNYWFGARNRLQFNFRHQKVSQEFIRGGGTLTDVGVRSDYWLRSNLSVSASLQYERWLIPVIQPNESRNVSATVEILFQPQKLFQRSATNAASSASTTGGRP